MTKVSRVEIFMVTFLGVTIAVDCFLVASLRRAVAQNSAHAANLLYRDINHLPVQPPDGFTADGVHIYPLREPRRGWVIRYASSQCNYCQKDEKTWERLAVGLKNLDYEVYVITPSAKSRFGSDALRPEDSHEELYVSMEWLRHFHLTAQPSVLIFSPDHQLAWARQGMLAQGDPELAVNIAEKLEK
jgi:hypothetical protein